jgi:tryptophan halogenase
VEKKVDDPEEEIDSDYIFDCRGSVDRNPDDYTYLVNPLNSVLLYNKPGPDPSLLYTRSVATPNGWTFIIPNKDSLSYGYLYNNTITSKEEAMSDFLERFELPGIDGELFFYNYVAKNIFVGQRTILNGNRCFFIDPLEATATDFYHTIARYSWDYIGGVRDKNATNMEVRRIAREVQNFILWHYQSGSKFDTPFWKYAKSLPFNPDNTFRHMMKLPNDSDQTYGNWTPRIFDIWRSNT